MALCRKPWTNPPQITDAEFRRIVSEIPPLCKQYDNAGTIVQFLARFNLHEYTCPAVRYVYPIRPIFNFLQSTLGWTYYGSASPETNVPNTNCVRSTDTPQDYICCGIGLGYLILGTFNRMDPQSVFILTLCLWYRDFFTHSASLYSLVGHGKRCVE